MVELQASQLASYKIEGEKQEEPDDALLLRNAGVHRPMLHLSIQQGVSEWCAPWDVMKPHMCFGCDRPILCILIE
jgi:hypothetical protein